MRLLILFFLLMFITYLSATSFDPAPPFPDKIEGNGMICFYVDLTDQGHGFIKIKTSDGKWRSYGFYPTGEWFSSPLFDRGQVQDDGERKWHWKICYNVTAELLTKAFNTIDKWKKRQYYELLGCCGDQINN